MVAVEESEPPACTTGSTLRLRPQVLPQGAAGKGKVGVSLVAVEVPLSNAGL